MTIESILTEWRYRLKKGYPTSDSDYQILDTVLSEMTSFNIVEREKIVNRARGLNEQLIETNTITNAIDFETYVLDNYSVKGQTIIGLPGMYDAIMNSNESRDLLDLITTSSRVMELSTGVIPIRGVYGTLYKIIRNTIKIPNGDESELWFAIAFKGLVKGAVAGESGIEADIEVGNQTVSLKNYDKITFDFGSLASEGVQLLNSFLEMAKLLTGQDISKSKGREQINTVLDFLDNEKTEVDIRRIIQLGEESDIPMLRNISNKLQSFYKLDDNLDTMIHAFCNIVDKMITEKITSVNWWGMIIKSNQTLFLESATELAPTLKCRNDRLSPAIANFHQNKLFVLGSQLNTKVTKKSQD